MMRYRARASHRTLIYKGPSWSILPSSLHIFRLSGFVAGGKSNGGVEGGGLGEDTFEKNKKKVAGEGGLES